MYQKSNDEKKGKKDEEHPLPNKTSTRKDGETSDDDSHEPPNLNQPDQKDGNTNDNINFTLSKSRKTSQKSTGVLAKASDGKFLPISQAEERWCTTEMTSKTT